MRLLMRHQQKGKRFIIRHDGRAALTMAPGTGKTLLALRTVEPPVLIICRRDDFFTWSQELETEHVDPQWIWKIESGDSELPEFSLDPVCHCGDSVASHNLFSGHSPVALIDPVWVMVTYDLVKNPRIQAYLKAQSFKWVIADESHMLRGFDSARTKACYAATRHIPLRLPMTGSMIGNNPIDCFSQIKFVDDGRLLGDNPYTFRERYYIPDPSGKGWYLRRGAKQEIRRKLERICYGVHEDDVLDLPPIRRLYKAVPMSRAQQRMYNQVVEEWEYQLSSEEIVEIDYVIVQVAKLRQISSGFLYVPLDPNKPKGPRDTIWLDPSAKLELLLDMCHDPAYLKSKEKLVIWCAHTAEIERIAQELPRGESVQFYGSLSRADRELSRRLFSKKDSVKYFIGQADAGVGMNELVVADTAVYFSNSRRVISRFQSERRIRRKGSERHKTITYWDLLCEKSIDTRVVKDLGNKMDIAAYILHQLRKGKSLKELVT